ncbi:hypothetical protein BH10ACI4_BH10ACI4_12430 [soil metagenome]
MHIQALTSTLLISVLILSPVDGGMQKDRTDAVIAAPASHVVLLENSRVRVLQVTIPPGVTEPAHTHAWPSVMRFESPQPLTYITYSEQDGKQRETERFEVPMGKAGTTEWSEPEGLHAVKNRGTSAFRAIRIELKPNSTAVDKER